MAAVETGNHSNVGKLILRGASCIDEALDKSCKLKTYSVTATLLIVKAAMVDDQILILTLYGENVDGLVSKIPITVGDNLFELQNCVLDQSFKTAVAIEMSRRNNALKVREELLLRTGIDKEERTVLWFGLRLTQLEISWLQKVDWVKELMLARNEFPSLPKEMGTYLKHCTKIDLQQNRLRKVPYSLLELPCIATLNLSHNYIVEIPDVPQLPASLSVLKLSHNHLRSLPNFGAPKLETLDISFNQLNTVPDCVCSFLALTTLNIAYNSTVLILPNQLGQLKNLHDLNLEGLNDLNHPPKNYRASTDDCIQYLNSQLRNAHEYLHMKLMVLGKHGVGKSTIVAKLLSKQISSESCSVVISKWKLTPQSSGKRTFNFRIWDFSNQEGYDATYHCFLSKRSMYLLLWNVTEGDDGVSSLKPFLDSISTQVPDSCVIIVGTFLDMLSDEEKSEKVDYLLGKVQELTAQYHSLFVAGCNVVGLQDETEDLVKLKDDIYNAASEYKLNNRCVMGAMIPSSYHTLDRKLISIYQKLKDKKNGSFMYAGEFRKLIRDNGLTDIKDDDYEEIHNASQFLHEVGALLFYANGKHNLDDLYIIDPSFLYDILSAVVSVKQRKCYVKQGILTVKDLFFIVKDSGFLVKYFLTLLNKFEIALPLDEGCKRVLIPSMLPKTSPTILPDDKHYFKRFILFSSPLSESQYFSYPTPSSLWSQLLSNVTNSIKKVMDILNEQIPVDESDMISSSVRLSSDREIRSFNIISDEVSDISSSVRSETMSPMMSYSREESLEHDGPQVVIPTTPEIMSSGSQQFKRCESLDEVNTEGLVYWCRGLMYNVNGLCFVISSMTNSSKHKYKDGIVIMCSPTVEGRKVLCRLIELVKQLISTHYATLLDNLEQRVPCHVCITVGVQDPFEFQVDQLLPLLSSYSLTTKCGVSHKVHLRDLVPTDLDPVYLLDANKVICEESHLGTGISTINFTGKNTISIGCVVSSNEAESEPHELWICCDGIEGTELHIFKTNPLERVNKHFLKMVQVCCVKQCAQYIWVATQVDVEDGIVFIFDKRSQELMFEIATENIVVSCIANSDHNVYIGTEEGYCFDISMDVQFKYINIWSHQHTKVSEYCIDGLVLTHTHLWLSSYSRLYILDLDSLDIKHMEETAERHTHVGRMILSFNNHQVWATYIGGVIVSLWDACQFTCLYEFNVGVLIKDKCHVSDPRDQIITAMCTSLNTVWIGIASGHIIAFDMNHLGEVLNYYKLYHGLVYFLSSVDYNQSGECMMLSGGKLCQPGKDCFPCKDENGHPLDITGVAIMWSFKKHCMPNIVTL